MIKKERSLNDVRVIMMSRGYVTADDSDDVVLTKLASVCDRLNSLCSAVETLMRAAERNGIQTHE